ncbi:unnamed protein product [Somion occarium]|uniref:Thiamine phosphate synthase/TenI domain-containing protein n=1 Tax=Somion occarium TaxID=3059160 RepID=A0ABP1DGU3_9APHY
MAKPHVDYSLYLVTGRDLLPPGKDYFESLEESIRGGVTLVQIREKATDTGKFLEIARRSLEICHKYSVPLLINDRIDIALAIGADGVHLGQADMPIDIARSLLPPNSIIGKTCNNSEHVRQAVEEGVDYVGLGPVWGTKTKDVTAPTTGPRGIGTMLDELEGSDVKAVAIAGIKSTNVLHCLHGSVSPASNRSLDGVAVVSDIVASIDPFTAASKIVTIVKAFKRARSEQTHIFSNPLLGDLSVEYDAESVKKAVGKALNDIKEFGPLVHQITNNVVTTQSANATLALGGSPIMATAPEEMEDLSKVTGALLVNFGTIQSLAGMLAAGRNANINRKPIVFDPVGVGATQYRKTCAQELLNEWQATVIKGNAGELAALANSNEVQARGVDSVGNGFADPAEFVRSLARKERCIIALTGTTDYISDGYIVLKLSNGHPLLGEITGSGCMVGTCVATFCAGVSLREHAERVGGEDDGRLARGKTSKAVGRSSLPLSTSSGNLRPRKWKRQQKLKSYRHVSVEIH